MAERGGSRPSDGPRRPASHLFVRLHRDQRGAVSLETILIVAAIALPILIFVLKFGWPKVRDYFNGNLGKLQEESTDVTSGVSNN